MRVQFRIENPRELKPAYRSKMVFTQRGGVIGASAEADWPLQDIRNSLPDFLARIEIKDDKLLITSFPGAEVFLNKSSSPLRPNRSVILRRDDYISFGLLKICLGEDLGGDFQYSRLDDAVDVSSLVTINKGHRGLVDGEVIEIEAHVPEEHSWSQENKWSGHYLLDDDADDAVLRANPEYRQEKSRRNKPENHREKIFNQPADQGALINPPISNQSEPRWKQEFADLEAEEKPMTNETASQDASRASALDASQMLIILSQTLGVPLGDIPEAELPEVLADLGMTLRAAIEGLNGIYNEQISAKANYPMARADIHAIEDNPLRFSRDVDEALRVMFLERHPVHLAPRAAVLDSVDQIQTHNASTKASVEEGLKNLLKAFEPQNLEKRFGSYRRNEKEMSDDERDAWCWRTYKAYIQEMTNQRQQGLASLFWEVFQNAYHEQMRGSKELTQHKTENEV